MTNTTAARRFGWRDGLGAFTLLAAVLTMVWPDWIEEVFHVDPDNGSGALEVGLLVGLALVSAVSFLSARSARRRLAD